MSMLGLRDLVLIAPTPSSLHHHHHQGQPISENHTHHSHTHTHTHTHNNLNPLPSSSSSAAAASLSVGFGIFPLLTATPCVPTQPHQNNEVQDHCGGNTNTNTTTNYWNLKMCPEVMNNPNPPPKKGVINVAVDDDDDDDNDDKNKGGAMESEENGVYGPGFRVCQDCGNRAKKDCIFRRCRTCCKGRGYGCNTHVKSTWVSSVRRREREREIVVVAPGGGGDGHGGGGGKRQRAVVGSSRNATATSHTSHSSNSNNATTPKSLATTSFLQDGSFKQTLPGHVRAPAVFKCHRVSAIGNGEGEYAYMATVHISGHVFKGFLYDHGVDGKTAANAAAAAVVVPNCVSELQLGNNCSGKNRECSSSIANNNAYPASAT